VDYHIDIPNRRVYLSEEIDEHTTDLLIKALHHLDSKTGDIEFWINSSGGSVPHMWALYDAIQNCENKVICIGTGHVASAATLLLVAGDESYATKHTMFMAHEGNLTFEEGEDISPITLHSDLTADMRETERWCTRMAHHTMQTAKWWKKNTVDSKKSMWLDVDDMIDKGIIKSEWPI
jgi:ATP-dependent protease ClpP protease subunit